MQIACAALNAAKEAVMVLVDAYLRPGVDYEIVTTDELDSPIAFVITSDVPADTMRTRQGCLAAKKALGAGLVPQRTELRERPLPSRREVVIAATHAQHGARLHQAHTR